MRKKRLQKIFNKITLVVQKGKDSYLEYSNYIQDSIDNGEYSLLEDVFINYFGLDIRFYNTISLFKQKSFDVVRFNTYSGFQYKLKTYYDNNNVYQVGMNIYDKTTNNYLGNFAEIDKINEVNHMGATYSYFPSNIYYKDPELFKKLDEAKVVNLYVTNSTNVTTILGDKNLLLLDKYKLGINILKGIILL